MVILTTRDSIMDKVIGYQFSGTRGSKECNLAKERRTDLLFSGDCHCRTVACMSAR